MFRLQEKIQRGRGGQFADPGSLPAEWATWHSLEGLYLPNNRLSGSLPDAWGIGGGLDKLFFVDLAGNLLTGSHSLFEIARAYPSASRLSAARPLTHVSDGMQQASVPTCCMAR